MSPYDLVIYLEFVMPILHFVDVLSDMVVDELIDVLAHLCFVTS